MSALSRRTTIRTASPDLWPNRNLFTATPDFLSELGVALPIPPDSEETLEGATSVMASVDRYVTGDVDTGEKMLDALVTRRGFHRGSSYSPDLVRSEVMSDW